MTVPGASRDPYQSIDAAVGSSLEAELGELEAWDVALRGEGPEPSAGVPVAPPPEGWFPCPCCGHRTFGEPGGYEICSVCFWEDDPVQLRWPLMSGGANALCLVDAQANYQRLGAVEERFRGQVRPPAADEPRDPGWRPVDLARDPFEEAGGEAPWPDELTALYWWRPDYWRRGR